VENAKKKLLQGLPDEAVQIAFKALLDVKEELGGDSSILLLPSYFILAEAYISNTFPSK